MYTLGVGRDFSAIHYLVGGDWGAENEPHSHHYRMEVRLEGNSLDEHGYLTDIVAVEAALDPLLSRYRNCTLNELPEFAGLNPSIEHFSRILCQRLAQQITAGNIHAISVQLWENEIAWAAFRMNV